MHPADAGFFQSEKINNSNHHYSECTLAKIKFNYYSSTCLHIETAKIERFIYCNLFSINLNLMTFLTLTL